MKQIQILFAKETVMKCSLETMCCLACVVIALSSVSYADGPRKETQDIDPRLALASDAKNKTETSEAKLNKTMAELFETLDLKLSSMPDGIENERAAVEVMLAVTQKLNELAKSLIEKYDEYLVNVKKYKAALQAAIPVFLQAANANQEYAEQESYAAIADDYRMLADSWELMAKAYKQRADEIDGEADITETMQFVRRSAVFLDRLEAHLSSFPTTGEAGVQRDAFLQKLRTYIEGFEDLRLRMRTIHDHFEKAVDPDRKTEHKPLESRTFYLRDNIKVICPNIEKARILKEALTMENAPFSDKPFQLENDPPMTGKGFAPAQTASYVPKKVNTVPEMMERINRLQDANRKKGKQSAPPPRTTPDRERTTRYVPPPQNQLPPPLVLVGFDKYGPILEHADPYSSPMPVVMARAKSRHR
jgi:hypothetical protein